MNGISNWNQIDVGDILYIPEQIQKPNHARFMKVPPVPEYNTMEFPSITSFAQMQNPIQKIIPIPVFNTQPIPELPVYNNNQRTEVIEYYDDPFSTWYGKYPDGQEVYWPGDSLSQIPAGRKLIRRGDRPVSFSRRTIFDSNGFAIPDSTSYSRSYTKNPLVRNLYGGVDSTAVRDSSKILLPIVERFMSQDSVPVLNININTDSIK